MTAVSSVMSALLALHDGRVARSAPVLLADELPELAARPRIGWDPAMGETISIVLARRVKGSERLYWNGKLVGPEKAVAEAEANARAPERLAAAEAKRERRRARNVRNEEKKRKGTA
jgi:hypothetical protein